MGKTSDNNETYYFGDIKEYNLEKIEAEVLNETVYLDVFAGSDLRFKKNIKPLSDVMTVIHGLGGVSYDYKVDDFPQYNFSSKKQIGFIAQEAEKVLPEIVTSNADGYLGIDYAKVTPLLVEAIKELEIRLSTLERENRQLKEKISGLKRPQKKNLEFEV